MSILFFSKKLSLFGYDEELREVIFWTHKIMHESNISYERILDLSYQHMTVSLLISPTQKATLFFRFLVLVVLNYDDKGRILSFSCYRARDKYILEVDEDLNRAFRRKMTHLLTSVEKRYKQKCYIKLYLAMYPFTEEFFSNSMNFMPPTRTFPTLLSKEKVRQTLIHHVFGYMRKLFYSVVELEDGDEVYVRWYENIFEYILTTMEKRNEFRFIVKPKGKDQVEEDGEDLSSGTGSRNKKHRNGSEKSSDGRSTYATTVSFAED